MRFAPTLLVAALILGSPQISWAQPVAIVTEVDGPVRIVAPGRGGPPEVADAVQADSLVELERDARLVLAYPEQGSIYELRGPGRFIAAADAVQLRAGPGTIRRRDLAPTLRALQIRTEGSTVQGSAAMRGASALELQAEGPTGSQFARDPIRLCWRSLGPHWSYRVRLIDDDGSILFEARTMDLAIQLPATLALKPNAAYLWHLAAQGPDNRSAEAAGQFRRVEAEREQAMLAAEAAIAGATPTEQALYRIARQQHGFVDNDAPACAGGRNEQGVTAP